MRVSVVVAGQIRDEPTFKEVMLTLAIAREQNVIQRVILSTWHEEVERHENLREYLKSQEAFLVTSRCPELLLDYQTDPPAPKSVTILQQIKAVRLGVEACNDDDWVIRVRPDLSLSVAFLRQMIPRVEELQIPIKDGWPKIFDSRIWVMGGLAFQPFFINDTVFAGKKGDLQKLATPHVLAQLFGLKMNCEQHLFSAPFWDAFPIVLQYFRANLGPANSSRELAMSVLWRSLQDPFFLRVLGVYYNVLDHYLLVGKTQTDKELEKIVDDLRKTPVTFEEFLRADEGQWQGDLSWCAPAQSHWFSGMSWMKFLKDGHFSPSPLRDLLLQALSDTATISLQKLYSSWLVDAPKDVVTYMEAMLDLRPDCSYAAADFPVRDDSGVTIVGRHIQASMLEPWH